MSMQNLVIDRVRKNFLVIKEMELLLVGKRDLRMLV